MKTSLVDLYPNGPAVSPESPFAQSLAATQIANILARLTEGCPLIEAEMSRAQEILHMAEVFVSDYVHDIGKARS